MISNEYPPINDQPRLFGIIYLEMTAQQRQQKSREKLINDLDNFDLQGVSQQLGVQNYWDWLNKHTFYYGLNVYFIYNLSWKVKVC